MKRAETSRKQRETPAEKKNEEPAALLERIKKKNSDQYRHIVGLIKTLAE